MTMMMWLRIMAAPFHLSKVVTETSKTKKKKRFKARDPDEVWFATHCHGDHKAPVLKPTFIIVMRSRPKLKPSLLSRGTRLSRWPWNTFNDGRGRLVLMDQRPG